MKIPFRFKRKKYSRWSQFFSLLTRCSRTSRRYCGQLNGIGSEDREVNKFPVYSMVSVPLFHHPVYNTNLPKCVNTAF